MNNTKDRWIFLGCFLLAIIFWTMQKLSNNYRFTQRYTVRYSIPDGKIFRRQPTTVVEVTLVGIGWDIFSKSAKNIGDKIEVELTGDDKQVIPSASIAEKINAILSSDDISVAQIRPTSIEIFLEDQANKKVPVASKLNIDYMQGYYIKKEPRLVPDSVVITGAAQLLNEITSWNTEIVNITQLNENIVDMPIALESSNQDLLRVSHSGVRLNLEIEEFTEKRFSVPLMVKNSDNEVRVLPDKVDVRCVIGLSKYDLLNEDDIELYINLDESLIGNGLSYAPISISKMPSFVRHLSYTPRSARFFIVQQ